MQNDTLEKFLDWPVPSELSDGPSECLFNLQEAVERATHHAQTYLFAHSFDQLERTEEAMGATVKLAVARLEWLLDDARQQISGMFSQDEILLLLNCYQGEFLTPDECQRMASTLCHGLGIELEHYRESCISDLVDKLRTLTIPQRMALADALEVSWHSGQPVKQTLADMAIELR